MADIHDAALIQESRQAHEARLEQEKQDQLDNDRKALSGFVDWLYDKDLCDSLVVTENANEVYVDGPGGAFWLKNGQIRASNEAATLPWQILWELYLRSV